MQPVATRRSSLRRQPPEVPLASRPLATRRLHLRAPHPRLRARRRLSRKPPFLLQLRRRPLRSPHQLRTPRSERQPTAHTPSRSQLSLSKKTPRAWFLPCKRNNIRCFSPTFPVT